MSDAIHSTPVRFSPDVETIPDGEADAIKGLGEQVKAIQDKTLADYGTAIRGIHAKGHAIVNGTIKVISDLPPELAQGLFATAGSYEALLRLDPAGRHPRRQRQRAARARAQDTRRDGRAPAGLGER